MSLLTPRRSRLSLPIILGVLSACQDQAVPTQPDIPAPLFAQGDAGLWTVNSLADPGTGTCDDTECTLREAIAATSGSATLTRIVFAPGLQGNITLTAGQLVLEDMFTEIDGDGRIAVDAAGQSRVMSMFRITPHPGNPTVTLSGLTLKNGIGANGGGILAQGSDVDLTLDHVMIQDNSAGSGVGGGLASSNGATVTVLGGEIAGNEARQGGGIYNGDGSTLTLRDVTVAGNSAAEAGGGIFSIGRLEVSGSAVTGNTSPEGVGGIYTHHFNATITRSTISGNFGHVGGIRNEGTLAIRSSTVTRNFGEEGTTGAILHVGGGMTRVANSIIAGNPGKEECAGGVSSFDSQGYNLVTQDGECDFFSEGDVRIDGALVFTQVLEVTLSDNGGPTRTHALIVRGRAVDAGYCPGETADQRGLGVPVDEPILANAKDGCDIGAYELQGPLTPIADLMVSQSANKTSVKQGDLLTYTVRVRNLGGATAPNVVVTNVLSSGVTFVSAQHAKGTHTAPPVGETGTVTWYLGDLADQANETVEIKVTVRIKGKTTITNTASVTGDVVDPNPGNNSASLAVSVASGSTGPKGGKP